MIAAVVAMLYAVAAQDSSRDTLADPIAHVDTSYHREEFRGYLLGTFGPRPIIRALALAGFDQWRRHPPAFPQNERGFADRLGSRYAQVAISRTIRFGLARALDERTIRYQPCVCGDSSSRTAYALLSPFRVSTPRGIRLSAMNPIAELTSGILVTSAQSGGLHVGEGIRNGITGLAFESAASVVREFWPWRWRPPFL